MPPQTGTLGEHISPVAKIKPRGEGDATLHRYTQGTPAVARGSEHYIHRDLRTRASGPIT